ncbi:hypothetical protein F4811DRAFT_539786 [Daldinia bambusicola]|nr:hypothetical protein F4811DRAFT_539786 [Daldinia bambusicola]
MPSSTSPHPDQRGVEPHPIRPRNVDEAVACTPHPENSLQISAARREIQQKIINLYCGQASEENMRVYAEKAIYDDPFSYCDTRYKIAGQ